jgi:Holliday junction resolvase RusA-like endonuclease
MVRSKVATEYKQAVRAIINSMDIEPTERDCVLTLRVYRPRKVGDLDNRQKVLIDALNELVYLDDKQVVEIHSYRHDDKKNPRVEVTCVEK